MINQIVRQVVAGLQNGGATGRDPTGREGSLTKPDVAVRTGQSLPPGRGRLNARESAPMPAKVFVTAEMLQQRLACGGDEGVIELAHNEFLTPNARDLVDEKHLAVRKATEPVFQSADATGESSAPVGSPCGISREKLEAIRARDEVTAKPQTAAGWAIGLITSRTDAKTDGALSGLAHDGVSMVCFNQTECWMRNLQAMCEAVATGAVSAGVAVLPYAANAVLLANKIRGVRAVQATRPESVAAAVRHFGANVLVVEHAFSTFHEMRRMMRSFALERPGPPMYQELMDLVAQLEAK